MEIQIEHAKNTALPHQFSQTKSFKAQPWVFLIIIDKFEVRLVFFSYNII